MIFNIKKKVKKFIPKILYLIIGIFIVKALKNILYKRNIYKII